MEAALDANGQLVGWQHRIVGQSIMAGTAFAPIMIKNGIDVRSNSAFAGATLAARLRMPRG
jgi:isoquinoline 1-oxidoreductase subunit beta